jgi:hypothetical protein
MRPQNYRKGAPIRSDWTPWQFANFVHAFGFMATSAPRDQRHDLTDYSMNQSKLHALQLTGAGSVVN